MLYGIYTKHVSRRISIQLGKEQLLDPLDSWSEIKLVTFELLSIKFSFIHAACIEFDQINSFGHIF